MARKNQPPTAPSLPSSTSIPADVFNENLLNIDLVRRRFLRVAFAGSHGADGDDLGAGLLYYTLTRLARAKVALCVGSGGGFVPALMAQGQNDGHFADCRVYLVDAVLPELAFGSPLQSGGWLTHGNTVLEQYPQMRVARMLSSQAARLFAEQGVQIDYLHIDGDHSKAGVRADLDDFSLLLSDGAMVSLLDSSKAPVYGAIDEFLAANPRFEKIGLPEIGAGTTVLRAPYAGSSRRIDAADRKIDIDPDALNEGEALGRTAVRFERWRYLTTPAYQARYAVAAPWIDEDGATVVEIGGYPNSTIHHLTKAKRLIAIEPYAPKEFTDSILEVAKAKGIQVSIVPRDLASAAELLDRIGAFNIVALGLDLSGASASVDEFEQNVQSLYTFLSKTKRFALEWPDAVKTGDIWMKLQEWLSAEISQRITLDLSKDPAGVDFHVVDKRAVRNLTLGTTGSAVPYNVVATEIQAIAERIYEENYSVSTLPPPILALDAILEFRTGQDVTKYLGFGWSRLEPKFTLALGDESDIVFRWTKDDLKRVKAANKISFGLGLLPIVEPKSDDSRKIEIWCYETLLFDGRIAQATKLDFQCDARLLREDAVHALRIIHRDRVSPSQVRPGSTDKRELSIALIDLTLSCATDSSASGPGRS